MNISQNLHKFFVSFHTKIESIKSRMLRLFNTYPYIFFVILILIFARYGMHQERRSKKTLRADFNRAVRELAVKKAIGYNKAYNHIYDIFRGMHNLGECKVDINYICTNINYLAECLDIALAELNKN